MKKFNKGEYNKMCAAFMGYKLITPSMRKNPESWSSSYWENPEFNGSSKGILCSENGLQYDTNWNWIMRVIEKIKSLEPDYPGITEDVLTTLIWRSKEEVSEEIWKFLNVLNLYKEQIKL